MPRSAVRLAFQAVFVATPLVSQSQDHTTPSPVPMTARGAWMTHAGNPSHQANSQVGSQSLQRILWTTPIDQQPQYSGSVLLVHYGSPLCTPLGTVVLPVKTGAQGGFQVEARRARTGQLVWTMATDYVLPPHGWTPICGPTLQWPDRVVVPAAGGTVLVRSPADKALGSVGREAFYGLANYQANPAVYDANVVIDTPITSDDRGNLYFGFLVQGATPIGLQSGIARIAVDGTGTWIGAPAAANDPGIQRVVYNCAPALSPDGSSLYVAVTSAAASGFGVGYLLRLDAATLQPTARVRLRDLANPGNDAYLPDDGSACPTVGPDGDVFFGVLELPFASNNLRGWMLHFSGDLATQKPGGAFGWDDTCSIVPSAAVPQYTGGSPYLVLTKYNNYGGIGSGNGLNKVAVLDPNTTMTDPISGVTVMDEVLTVLSPTPDPNWSGGFREWCINTAAIDVPRHSAILNCEDGRLYRWDFATNTLIEGITLTAGIGQAYTSTIIAKDGTVFAMANAVLYAIGV